VTVGWIIFAVYVAGLLVVLYPAWRWACNLLETEPDELWDVSFTAFLAVMVAMWWPVIVTGRLLFLASRRLWRALGVEEDDDERVDW
jgi:hypothetical protein